MSQRQEIMNTFLVAGSRIMSPGQFQGCPVYTPYFYVQGLAGLADHVENGWQFFNLIEEDYREWPELMGCKQVKLYELPDGSYACLRCVPNNLNKELQ